MRYLFINTTAGYGSHGKIINETCKKLIEEGHECVVAWGRINSNSGNVTTLRIGNRFDVYLHAVRTRLFDREGFGSKRSTKKLISWIDEYHPDIIWLHNLHGYYLNIDILFNYIKRKKVKVFWTLHDCWAFTGHCAHFTYAGCYKWRDGCCDCVQTKEYPSCIMKGNSEKNYFEKKKLFLGIEDMTIFVPSMWLANHVKESFLGCYNIQVLPNTINTDIFTYRDSEFRKIYNLENKKIVLGVSGVWNTRKGLDDFIEISQSLDDKYQIVLVGVNKRAAKKIPPNILTIERTENQIQLAEIYSSADVYVTPSKEETFGMTVLEAMSCGTRAIVYKGTACEEVVLGKNGIAVASINEMIEEIKNVCENSVFLG